MKANDLRRKYIDFFVKYHGHAEIGSSSLIPENDPTVLFTTAGMHPLVPYLMGEKHPLGTRLVDCQKCVRTDDIDEVGDATHCTFFEMLGNWSLGDYFKEGAIKMSYEFLTDKEKGLGLSVEMLAVSCFEGDKDAPKDEESAGIWRSLGISAERIAFLPKKDNWWGPAGQTGPCGPDTEMFYWTGEGEAPEKFDPEDKRWVEIWNDVFMQYNKKADGTFEPLKKQNVDTGMGLERVTAILQGQSTHYETELFLPAMEKIEKLISSNLFNINVQLGSGLPLVFHSGRGSFRQFDEKRIARAKKFGHFEADEEFFRSKRIIADHLRSAVFILGDEQAVTPSNTDQGYVLRRLIRRAIRHGKKIGIQEVFCHLVADEFIPIYGPIYPEIKKNRDFILEQLTREEQQFGKTLVAGEKEFEKIAGKMKEHGHKEISGRTAFKLYDTYGFPLEMTKDLAKEAEMSVDEKGFEEAFSRHQELSRQGAEQKFAGGLADHSEQTTKLHTATHLLQAALRKVLGDHVYQRGSNITAERLRFDFSHGEKMTQEQIKEVERLVNEAISADLSVNFQEMTVEEAKEAGAIGVFESRYGEKVKVYTMGKSSDNFFSKEICGGPHVKHTAELGHFKILKEEASSSGVRRIKAVVE